MSNTLALVETASFKSGLNAGRPSARPNVFVVDSDASVRNQITDLVQRAGWLAESFAEAPTLLACGAQPGPSCLILELTPANLSELEVLAQMAVEPLATPVIFIADRFDVRSAMRAIRAGAIDLHSKPIDEQALLEAVCNAFEASEKALATAAQTRSLQARYAALSGRERDVMALVVAGLMNKQVGGKLGICEITVKAHRGQVMRKMQARTLVDLVHMSWKLREAEVVSGPTGGGDAARPLHIM